MDKLETVTNPTSCLNVAQPGEPLFILRAHDDIAPAVVRTWAEMYLTTKRLEGDPLTKQQFDKYMQAHAIASQMQEWKRKHPDSK